MTRRQPSGPLRRARGLPRGRALDPASLQELETLLAGRSRDRDHLIEHLHLLQDRFGHLPARHLRALAHWMRLPMAAVYETATFYAHFDIVDDGEPPPPALTIRVCSSLSCQLAGAAALADALSQGTDPANVRVVSAPCMGRCDEAPVAEVGRRHLGRATPTIVLAAVAAGDVQPAPIDWPSLEAHRGEGGYQLLADLRRGLTAKVFRTYLATTEVKRYLSDKLDVKGKTENEKLYIAKMANLQAAVMCNHKRTIPKSFEAGLEKKREQLKKLKESVPKTPKQKEALKLSQEKLIAVNRPAGKVPRLQFGHIIAKLYRSPRIQGVDR